MKQKIVLLFITIIFIPWLCGRSIHRKVDPTMPEIEVSWLGQDNPFRLRNYHLQEKPFFQLFDRNHFEKMKLPSKEITFRGQPTKSVHGKILEGLIEKVIDEILTTYKKLKEFDDFIILQKKDYNFKQQVGLLILKSKQYPFVVKVFIERPQTFIDPFHKGMEPMWFFFMGGGINRHLSGFTRIRNVQQVKQKIAKSSYWAALIDFPRKWYVHPKQSNWIKITGKNIGTKKVQTTQIPSIYCIVADAIEAERTLSLSNASDRKLALNLCNYLDQYIDSHIQNFMLEKQTQKIVIIDTEHFRSVVGFTGDQGTFNSYTQWYLHLAGKCAQDTFFTTKKDFKLLQQSESR